MKSFVSLIVLLFLIGCEPQAGLRVTSPKSGSQIRTQFSGGAGTFSIEGTASDIYGSEMKLMLFVSPKTPTDLGWYPQVSPLGVADMRPDGRWTANAQLGSREYPPSDGDTFDLAVLALTSDEEREILEQRAPIEALPQLDQDRVAFVEDVVIVR